MLMYDDEFKKISNLLHYLFQSARNVAVDQIKAVLAEDFVETKEQTYDIYLLPPGEDPETCQSYLRMRNKDGKYSLMFEVCFVVNCIF